jgi:hypothetical protein
MNTFPNLERKTLSQIKKQLGEKAFDTILGSYLADGSLGIYKGSKNARFQMRHSIIQKEWFLFKAEILSFLSSDKGIHIQKPDGFSKKEKLHFQTKVHPLFTQMLTRLGTRLVDGKKTKKVSRSWLNFLTPFSLMVWWCDDGSLMGGHQGVISTQGFQKSEVLIIVRYFAAQWKIHCHASIRHNKLSSGQIQTYWVVVFNTFDDLSKFLRIIQPYLPCKSMIYKFLPIVKDRQLQERWISELKQNNPSLANDIDVYVSLNKLL